MALVDRSERRHDACVAVLEEWRGPSVTTEAVLTETLYLVGPAWHAQQTCLAFFFRGAFVLVPSSLKSLQRVAALMEKYNDIPMDYADATLVVLGEELQTIGYLLWINVASLRTAYAAVSRLRFSLGTCREAMSCAPREARSAPGERRW